MPLNVEDILSGNIETMRIIYIGCSLTSFAWTGVIGSMADQRSLKTSDILGPLSPSAPLAVRLMMVH